MPDSKVDKSIMRKLILNSKYGNKESGSLYRSKFEYETIDLFDIDKDLMQLFEDTKQKRMEQRAKEKAKQIHDSIALDVQLLKDQVMYAPTTLLQQSENSFDIVVLAAKFQMNKKIDFPSQRAKNIIEFLENLNVNPYGELNGFPLKTVHTFSVNYLKRKKVSKLLVFACVMDEVAGRFGPEMDSVAYVLSKINNKLKQETKINLIVDSFYSLKHLSNGEVTRNILENTKKLQVQVW